MAKNQVIVSITSNVKGLQKGLSDSSSSLASFGKVAGAVAVAAGVALAAIGVKAVKSASELEQAMGGMEAVFKDSSGQMEKWANGAALSVGLAKSEYASLSTVLGAQLKNMGVSTDQLAGQTNKLVGLGADLAAQFGGSTSDAVSALSSLLRGERDPIERYGVSINEAAVKAKMAEMGLSGLTGEAEKNAKLTATLALLYEQTADAQGAFARESTTLAGAQQRLAAGTENLYATLGTSLLPAVTALTAALGALVGRVQESAIFQSFTGWLTDASNAFADFIFNILNGSRQLDFGSMFSGLLDAAINGITTAANWLANGGAVTLVNGFINSRSSLLDAAGEVFPVILDALIQAVPAIVKGLAALVTQLAQMLVTQVPILLQGAVTLFQSLVAALVTILPGLLTTILGLLPQLVQSLLGMVPALLATAIALFKALVDALVVILPLIITALVEMLPQLIETIVGMIPAILDGAIQLFTALIEAIPVILPLLLQAVIDLLPKIIVTLVKMLPKLLLAAIDFFIAIVEALPKIIPDLIEAVLNLLPEIIGALIGMIPDLLQAGIDLIGGLVSGLWKAASSVGKALLDIIGGAVDGFLSFLGIASPSKVFKGFGANVVQGLVKGLDGSKGLVSKSMDKLSGLVTDGFDATLTAPEMRLAVAGGGSGAFGTTPTGNVYNVHLSTLNATAETGRVIVESIRDYESAGGRL